MLLSLRCGACWGTGIQVRGPTVLLETRPPLTLSSPSRHHGNRALTCKASLEPTSSADKARRGALMLKYVNEADPKDTEGFVKSAPPAVVAAMRQTVSNLVGTLPATYFEVRVSTAADSLAHLFFTMAMTGYLFRSAQYRMELQSSFDGVMTSLGPAPAASDAKRLSSPATQAVASSAASVASVLSFNSGSSSSESSTEDVGSWGLLESEEKYAPGVQKIRVEGEVLRWHHENGLERIAASTYMLQLEEEVEELKKQLAAASAASAPTSTAPLPIAGLTSGEDGGWIPWGAERDGARKVAALAKLLPGNSRAGAAAASAAVAAAAGSRGELLDFLKGLSGDGMVGLTAEASPEVLDAIDAFVARLMGTSDHEQLSSMSSEFDSNELSKVLLWLLVVGYALRTAEDGLVRRT